MHSHGIHRLKSKINWNHIALLQSESKHFCWDCAETKAKQIHFLQVEQRNRSHKYF